MNLPDTIVSDNKEYYFHKVYFREVDCMRSVYWHKKYDSTGYYILRGLSRIFGLFSMYAYFLYLSKPNHELLDVEK